MNENDEDYSDFGCNCETKMHWYHWLVIVCLAVSLLGGICCEPQKEVVKVPALSEHIRIQNNHLWLNDNGWIIVPPENILYIEAVGSTVWVHYCSSTYAEVPNATLEEVQAVIDEAKTLQRQALTKTER